MIFRFIIAIIIVYFLYRLGRMLFFSSEDTSDYFPEKEGAAGSLEEELVKDPQCGAYVPISTAVQAKINGRIVYFCSKECRDGYLKADRN